MIIKDLFLILMIILFGFAQDVFGSGQKIIENTILKNINTSPDFQLNFQRPSYILESDDTKKIVYYCNNSKEECKINFNLTKPENGKTISSTLICKISTSFESDQFERCNPNTVIFPKGIHPINIKVEEKSSPENFSEYSFIVVNGEVNSSDLKIEEDKIIQLLDPEIEIISQPVYSGEVKIISAEVKIEEVEEIEKIITEQDSSIPLLNSPLLAKSGEVTLVPNFSYIFQRPSYVLSESIDNQYLCDKSKGECKINFKLIDEEKKDISSKFECEILLSFISSEYQKCNPNTIIFPKGNHKVIFKIFEKDNRENFKEKIIWLNNEKSSPQLSLLGEGVESNTNKILSKSLSGILIPSQGQETTMLTIPEFQYIFQRPSYILDSNNSGEYICDNSKDECKVNFTLVDLEEKDISSKFQCEISFSTEGFSPLKDCNPNTITFPIGENKVIFRIFEKDNRENFREKIIWVINEERTPAKALSSDLTPSQEQGGSTTLSIQKHYLPHTKIQVQGKIGKTKKVGISRMTCYTYSQCSINFTSGKLYKSQREGFNFRWNFGNGEKYGDYNPKSIKFSPGEYKVRLTVSDDYGNKKTEIYRVSIINLYTKTEIKNINKTLDSITLFSLEDKILENLKTIAPSTNKVLTQYLDSLESIDLGGKLAMLPNTHKNPHSPSITSTFVEEEKQLQKLLAKNIKLRVSFQKKNLKIYGETFANSKVEIVIGDNIFTTKSDISGKYELKINTLTKGNYKIKASTLDRNGNLIAQKYSSEKEISTAYIAQLESYLITTRESTTKAKKTLKKRKSELEKALAKNISLRVSLQKKNLKIYGTTTPNSKIIFTIGKQKFTTTANSTGKYALKTNSIEIGQYKIIASVYKSGKLIAQKSSAIKTFSLDYITKMKSFLNKPSYKKNTSSSKYKKFTLENFSPKIPSFISSTGFNIKVFVINMLIAILSLILLFVTLIKRKLI